MPLIDEENSHLDTELMGDVAGVFSRNDGLIIDDDGINGIFGESMA